MKGSKILILTVLTILAVFPLRAQNSRIEEIREMYIAINEWIENHSLFEHRVDLETLVPGIGIQYTTIRFYYPFNQVEVEGETMFEEPHVYKITVDYMVAASQDIHIEYVFSHDEELIFYYYRVEGYICGERRYYFDNDKPIKIRINPLEDYSTCMENYLEEYEKTDSFSDEDMENTEEIIRKAEEYKSFFDTMVKIEHLDK